MVDEHMGSGCIKRLRDGIYMCTLYKSKVSELNNVDIGISMHAVL